jgi:hypothetical protein
MRIEFRVAVMGIFVMLLLMPSNAHADLFQFSFQTYQVNSTPVTNISGSGTFDASPQCTQTGTNGFYTINSLAGTLSVGNAPNANQYAMGITFAPCTNLVDPTGQLSSSILHNQITFNANGDQWLLEHVSVTNPFPFFVQDLDNPSLWGPVNLTITSVPIPEGASLPFLGMGLLCVGGLALFKNRLGLTKNRATYHSA